MLSYPAVSQNAASSHNVQLPVTIETRALAMKLQSRSSRATSSVAACSPTTSRSSTVIDLTESNHEIRDCSLFMPKGGRCLEWG